MPHPTWQMLDPPFFPFRANFIHCHILLMSSVLAEKKALLASSQLENVSSTLPPKAKDQYSFLFLGVVSYWRGCI